MPKKKATVQDLLEKARRTKTITLGGDTGPAISFQALGFEEPPEKFILLASAEGRSSGSKPAALIDGLR